MTDEILAKYLVFGGDGLIVSFCIGAVIAKASPIRSAVKCPLLCFGALIACLTVLFLWTKFFHLN
jgi:hypothetical protein